MLTVVGATVAQLLGVRMDGGDSRVTARSAVHHHRDGKTKYT
jgi:hypothetical protein